MTDEPRKPTPEELDAYLREHTALIGQRDLATLPHTPWLIPGLLLDRAITIVAGRGGVGKSTHAWQIAVSVAAGVPFAWWDAPDPRRVLVISGEDDLDEIERRVSVACQSMGVDRSALADRFIAWSEPSIRMVERDERGRDVPTMLYRAARRAVAAHGVGLVVIDPLVKASTGFAENDNDDQELVLARLLQMVAKHDCAILIDDHASKQGGTRGASSKVDFGRINVELTAMTEDEHERLRPPLPRRHYVRFDDPKQNYGPKHGVDWFRFEELPVGNGETRAALRHVSFKAAADFADPLAWEHSSAFLQMVEDGRDDGQGRWSAGSRGNKEARLDAAVADRFGLTLKQAQERIAGFEDAGVIHSVGGWDANRNKVRYWEVSEPTTTE